MRFKEKYKFYTKDAINERKIIRVGAPQKRLIRQD